MMFFHYQTINKKCLNKPEQTRKISREKNQRQKDQFDKPHRKLLRVLCVLIKKYITIRNMEFHIVSLCQFYIGKVTGSMDCRIFFFAFLCAGETSAVKHGM